LAQAELARWRIEPLDDGALRKLSGDWLVGKDGLRASKEIHRVVAEVGDKRQFRFDTSGLARWDSALVVFVRELLTTLGSTEDRPDVDVSGLPVSLQRLLALAQADRGPDSRKQRQDEPASIRRVASWFRERRAELDAFAELIGVAILSIVPAIRGALQARSVDLVQLMQESGVGALGIVTVVNSLVGAILAFVGGVELKRFGASIYVADLVGVAIIREMASIMTGIVMAGRTGGAYAAQIATMEGNEEIDALRTLGISPYQYLVVPRILALAVMMPILYFYSCLVGVAGGLLVSVATLGTSPTVFLDELRLAVDPPEFYIGLTKTVCFGAFIALSACRIGLRAGRSAAEVGRAATGAVVAGIVGIIALDAVFAACTNVLGI